MNTNKLQCLCAVSVDLVRELNVRILSNQVTAAGRQRLDPLAHSGPSSRDGNSARRQCRSVT